MDARVLGQLIAERGPGLVLYARQWSTAPEDIVQEAFLKLSQQATVPERVVPWLYRVVRNQAISRARAELRQRKHETAAARPTRWFANDDDLNADAVTTALRQLPDDERETILLHVWGGLTFAEIAALVGSTSSTVHRRYGSGIERLRERLGSPCPNNETR